MSNAYICPFCQHTIAKTEDTYYCQDSGFSFSRSGWVLDTDYSLKIHYFNCPNCSEISSIVTYSGKKLPKKVIPIYPISSAKQFPAYIPLSIREDYEEACAIVSLSPKASATLSRRCLQGMIRDFWNIKESNLSKAITALQNKIPAQQWRVLDGVRRIGNIGAHMEKDINIIVDIDPNEANKLIKLIELLLDQWYINRHDQDELYSDIIDIDNAKQADRKKSE